MVRTYIRKSNRAQYSRDVMRQALTEIRNGMSTRCASKVFSIPRTTLIKNLKRPDSYIPQSRAVRRRRRRPNVGVALAPFSWSVHVTLYTSYMLLDFCNAVYNKSSFFNIDKNSKNDAGVFCNSPWCSNETQRRKSKSVFVDNFVKMKADAKSFV